MPVDDKHPDYDDRAPEWQLMSDAYEGERAVKDAGPAYLPPTSGHRADGYGVLDSEGNKAYEAYKTRSVFPELVEEAVKGYVGVMYSKPPTIELPPTLEYLLENATPDGEGLEDLLRRINVAQLVEGRLGLLLDMPSEESSGTPRFYVAVYGAANVVNWDEGPAAEDGSTLRMVVLDESGASRVDMFKWTNKKRHRVLVAGDGMDDDASTYGVAVVEGGSEFAPDNIVEPTVQGRKLDRIPFVFVNAADVLPSPSKPPLLGLARLSMVIYRGEADYRQSLFMQGQDTLVIKGVADNEEEVRVGAGAQIRLANSEASAEYIGVSSDGLKEQREALRNDRGDAATMGGQLLDNQSRQKESGEALHIRVAASTANLNQIARTGAGALEQILRVAAVWIGADPDAVKVTPNLDFSSAGMNGQELVHIMTAKSLGLPLSDESIHEVLVRRELTSKTYEEELQALDGEEPADEVDDEDVIDDDLPDAD